MKYLSGLIVALGLLWALPADAANTCNVKEYEALGIGAGGTAQIAKEPGLVDQTPVDASTVHSSQAFSSTTRFIRVYCDAQTSYVVGPPPQTATTSNSRVINGEYWGVTPGHVISFIASP